MKILSVVILALVLSACGKGGGTNGADQAVAPDTTPHAYGVSVYALNGNAAVTLHQVCDFGLGTQLDSGVQSSNILNGFAAGSSCGFAAHNYSMEVVVTGAVQVYFEVTIDGVAHPELEHIISAGDTYTFQRGY